MDVKGALIKRVDGCLHLDPQYDAQKAMRRCIRMPCACLVHMHMHGDSVA